MTGTISYEISYHAACLLFNGRVLISGGFDGRTIRSSAEFRFTPISSTPIGTLIDELFIESWQNSSNYSSYYSICAPSNCRYTYVERNDFVYTLTTILGLYGGLTEGLPIVIWGSLQVYWKIRERIKRHRRIVPINSD
ncbi:unnamed protein product [Adineta ricciae]|uniref:Uncharacterized protein n=1 Tax=Adineta ricciae TaxID=249248 RepID=A0A814VGL5_ADIRI|nr:unnamed protein product [Adineta ricciae]